MKGKLATARMKRNKVPVFHKRNASGTWKPGVTIWRHTKEKENMHVPKFCVNLRQRAVAQCINQQHDSFLASWFIILSSKTMITKIEIARNTEISSIKIFKTWSEPVLSSKSMPEATAYQMFSVLFPLSQYRYSIRHATFHVIDFGITADFNVALPTTFHIHFHNHLLYLSIENGSMCSHKATLTRCKDNSNWLNNLSFLFLF